MGTLGASLSGNMIAGKEVKRGDGVIEDYMIIKEKEYLELDIEHRSKSFNGVSTFD